MCTRRDWQSRALGGNQYYIPGRSLRPGGRTTSVRVARSSQQSLDGACTTGDAERGNDGKGGGATASGTHAENPAGLERADDASGDCGFRTMKICCSELDENRRSE